MLGGRGRGRGRGAPPGFQPGAGAQDSFRGFREASKEIEENLSKHLDKQLEEMSDSDSDVDSDGADELLDRVLDSYRGSGPDTGLLAEAKELLKNAIQSSVCLICISSVRRTDPIWSCGTCYVSFHINCIQRWAKDTIFQQKQQLEGDPERPEKERRVCWSCPKCRAERPAGSIPAAYRCYCGRAAEPEWDPWQTPHSECHRPAAPTAGPQAAGSAATVSSPAALTAVRCKWLKTPALLPTSPARLCHPGPCPPCPQTVQQECHCGQVLPSPATRPGRPRHPPVLRGGLVLRPTLRPGPCLPHPRLPRHLPPGYLPCHPPGPLPLRRLTLSVQGTACPATGPRCRAASAGRPGSRGRAQRRPSSAATPAAHCLPAASTPGQCRLHSNGA
jgi:hypothetical protein